MDVEKVAEEIAMTFVTGYAWREHLSKRVALAIRAGQRAQAEASALIVERGPSKSRHGYLETTSDLLEALAAAIRAAAPKEEE